jgi:hypothetical protein
VESCCEFGIEPSGFIKLSSAQTTRDLSSSAQFYRVSLVS